MRFSKTISRSLPLTLLAASLLAGCAAATDGGMGDDGDDAVGTSSDALVGTWFPLDTTPKGTPAEIRFDAVASDAQVSYFDVVIHGFFVETKKSPTGALFSKITVPGLSTLGRLGQPGLPVFRGDVAITTSATDVRVLAVSRAGTKTFADMNVWPEVEEELDAPGGRPERFVQDPTVYALKTLFPAGDGAGMHKARSKMDGIKGVTTEGYPVRWNPATKVLTADGSVRFAVHHAGTVQSVRSLSKDKASGAATRFANWSLAQRGFAANLVKYEGDFLFVYPPKYKEEIAPLVAQKKARGYVTTELTTTTTGSTCASIRTAIKNWYATKSAASDKYAILVGDVDAIPLCTAPTGVPTDDLYASTDGDDLDEEIYLGRLSVDDETDLTNQVTKILRYENTPESFFAYGKALLVAHKEGAPGKYVGAHESVRTATYAVPPAFTTQYGSVAGVTNATVSAAINAGQGLVAYRGHGSSTEWWSWNQTSQSYFNADVMALTNAAKRTPVVWSFACNNAELGVSDSFGETWMEDIDNRAVSFYGATVPSGTEQNHELDRRMFKAVYDLGMTTQAKAIEYAEEKMASVVGSGNAWMYLLLGDPEMHIRRRAPKNLIIVASKTLPRCLGTTCGYAVEIRDDAGRPVPGAKISAYKAGLAGDEVLDNRYADATGRATLAAPARTAGTMQVAVEDADGNISYASVQVQ